MENYDLKEAMSTLDQTLLILGKLFQVPRAARNRQSSYDSAPLGLEIKHGRILINQPTSILTIPFRAATTA